MSSNFQIFKHRNTENLHLKLIGDFDVSSAIELINVVEENIKDVSNVFVHTSKLKKISSSGIKIFRQDINRIQNFSTNIKFTGKNAGTIGLDKKNIY